MSIPALSIGVGVGIGIGIKIGLWIMEQEITDRHDNEFVGARVIIKITRQSYAELCPAFSIPIPIPTPTPTKALSR